MKKIYILSGWSEAGKNEAQAVGMENGVLALRSLFFEKMLSLADTEDDNFDISDRQGLLETLKELHDNFAESDLANQFVNLVYDFMDINRENAISLDAVYRPELIEAFRQDKRFDVEVIWIETSLENRDEREFSKLKRTDKDITLREVELRTKAKDMIKQAAGADTVREMADSIVENNGTLAQYRDALKTIITQ